MSPPVLPGRGLTEAQAKPGHQWMMDGYLSPLFEVKAELGFLYHAEERELRVIVPEEHTVTAQQMLDACVVRFHSQVDPQRFAIQQAEERRLGNKFSFAVNEALRLSAGRPFEAIGFVFVSDAEAKRHLHQLWLRELQCWSLEGGQLSRRLDDA